MKLGNALYSLYAEPWLLAPEVHRQLCAIVWDHVNGAAHVEGGRAQEYPAPVNGDSGLFARIGDVARISIDGVIGRRLGDMERSSGAIDVMDIERAVEQARADAGVKGILLSVDSPGGSVAGVPEAAARIAAVAREKPVVAWTGGVMASGAYWLAAGTTEIMAAPSASVGSIGVYQAFLDESRAMEMAGQRMELFKTGKFKGMGISGLPLSDDQRMMLQARVDEVFGWFVAAVQAGRGGDVPGEAMQGQTFYAGESRRNYLIDAVGDESAALAEVRALI